MLDTLMTDGQKVVCFFHCWYRVLIFLGFTMYSYFLICIDYIYLTVGIRTLFPQLIYFFFRNVFNNIFDYHCKILLILSSYVSWFKTEFFQTYKYVNIDECKGFFFWHYLGMSHFDDTESFVCSSLVCFFLLERKSLLTAPLLMLFSL